MFVFALFRPLFSYFKATWKLSVYSTDSGWRHNTKVAALGTLCWERPEHACANVSANAGAGALHAGQLASA